MKHRLIWLVLVLTLGAVGCGSNVSSPEQSIDSASGPIVPAPLPTPTPTPSPTVSPTPSPNPTPLPSPTPTPTPTPVFTALNCGFYSGNVNCTGANLGSTQVALNFTPYFSNSTSYVVSAQISNNLGPGIQWTEYVSCPHTDYDGMVDCTCFTATIQTWEFGGWQLGQIAACGNGVNTTTNSLENL